MQWKSKSTTKRMGCGTSCTGTVISRASWSRLKNSVLSAYGGNGICGISGNTARRCTQSCRSQASLANLNEQAENMFLELVKQLATLEGITERIKAQDQMLWVQRMNNIRDRAIEIVNHELIYA